MKLTSINKLRYCESCINENCLYSCPSYELYKDRFFSPKSRALDIGSSIKKNKFDSDLLYYSCLHCSLCKTNCPHNVDIANMVLFAKREAIIYENSSKIINDFEKEFYKIEIEKNTKNRLKNFVGNNAKILFIPSYDDFNFAVEKLEKLNLFFKNLNLSVKLDINFFDSNLDLYLYGFNEEMISDFKTWIRSIKDIDIIVTSSFKILHIFKKIAPSLKIKTPKVLDIFTFLNKYNFNFKERESSLLIKNFTQKNYINFSYFYNIKKVLKYYIDSSYLTLNYNLDKQKIKELKNSLINSHYLKGIKEIIFYDESSKKLFENCLNDIKLVTVLDLIL